MNTTRTLTDDERVRLTMLEQIGKMNVLAISGGRIRVADRLTLSLPVANGYSVEVEYQPVPDLYEVRRVFVRGGKRWVKGVESGVYAFDLGETAYRASCYCEEFGEHRP